MDLGVFRAMGIPGGDANVCDPATRREVVIIVINEHWKANGTRAPDGDGVEDGGNELEIFSLHWNR